MFGVKGGFPLRGALGLGIIDSNTRIPLLPMSYMLLIIEPVGQRAERSLAEGQAAYASMKQFGESLHAQGKLKAVESLASTSTAVQIRKDGGKTRLIDGPFAEAKEMIGGFFLIDCATMAEAVDIARQCPAAEWATVEVRALAPCYDDSMVGSAD